LKIEKAFFFFFLKETNKNKEDDKKRERKPEWKSFEKQKWINVVRLGWD
jgi:hypothetical protein